MLDILKKMDVRCLRYRDDGVAELHQDDAFSYGNN
jgi:hypothetical protein